MKKLNCCLISMLSIFIITNAAVADISKSVNKGTIKGANLKSKSDTEITVTAGYGECSNHYWEIGTNIDINLSDTLSFGDNLVYIYIDDSESSFPIPEIIGSMDTPGWSDLKSGWYNGNDRCIGVVSKGFCLNLW